MLRGNCYLTRGLVIWKEVVNKDTDDLHINLHDALDDCEWRRMIEKTGTTEAETVMPRAE